MDLIDDHGRLLGLVNVVDALVVLFVAAVVVAGVAFVLQPEPEPATTETTSVQVTLQMTDVPPYLSDAIREGMTESDGDRTIATITDVERSPSTLIVTDQDGQVFVRDHPLREDLTITAELAVRETETGLTFKGRPLQIGRTVVLDLGTLIVEATVTDL